MSYLIILSNVFAYCAYKYSKVVEKPGGYKALIIQDEYMLWAIIMLMIGFVSFGLWAKLRQAYCIYNEKNEERRAFLMDLLLIFKSKHKN